MYFNINGMFFFIKNNYVFQKLSKNNGIVLHFCKPFNVWPNRRQQDSPVYLALHLMRYHTPLLGTATVALWENECLKTTFGL